MRNLPKISRVCGQKATEGIELLDVLEKGANGTGMEENEKSLAKQIHHALSIIAISDWLFMATLGVLMGAFSFWVDYCVRKLRAFHFFLLDITRFAGLAVQYVSWTGFALLLIVFPAALCFYVAPQAAGSGIPEMKTLLRGVEIKEYLTLRTLIVKCIGLIMVLSSGLPLGKEGPFVHIASALATLLFKLIDLFTDTTETGKLSKEMLAAACAVGVSSTYGAPIGGVLFSIEVTSVFFPLRNYWRCFLASLCSAIVFRLLVVAFTDAATVEAFSPTYFQAEFPFDITYLIPVCLLGVICGVCAAAFIQLFRKWTKLVKENAWIKQVTKSPFVYPIFIVLVIATIQCPVFAGKYFAGGLTPKEAVEYLFQNLSWNAILPNTSSAEKFNRYWSLDQHNHFIPITVFTFNMFWMTAVAITMTIPSGAFIPIFATGAGIGRLFGEAAQLLFTNGFPTVIDAPDISPGGYAVVGAAAFSGSVTNAISTSVVVTEMIGQTTYLLPTIIAVLVAIAVRVRFENSLYDTMICIKKLPYLPPLPSASSVYRTWVCDIMVRDVKYLTLNTTLNQMLIMIDKYPNLNTFPLVDDPASMILLGCVRRSELLKLLNLPQPRSHSYPKSTLRRSASRSTLNIRTDEPGIQDSSLLRRSKSLEFLHSYLTPVSHLKMALSHTFRLNHQEQTDKRPKKDHGLFTLPLPQEHTEVERAQQTQEEWFLLHGDDVIDYDMLDVDPTPFQLVERTSLQKVHALFSLLRLNLAYVTELGRLVGVVGLKELRQALETSGPKLH
uniref:Chloride channel protein n=1 Tax=Trichuris muris TaxID=70415 RepID=A0A5S6QA36_TRIMR